MTLSCLFLALKLPSCGTAHGFWAADVTAPYARVALILSEWPHDLPFPRHGAAEPYRRLDSTEANKAGRFPASPHWVTAALRTKLVAGW